MRLPYIIILSLGCLLSPIVYPQDVQTQYLKLQEAYTLRTQEIEERYQKGQRELLNKFILALVRVEQNYRDEGDLDGVIYCRELRETLLTTPGFPTIEEPPPAIATMLDTLEEKRRESLEQHQRELDQFNILLLGALEAYEREFTRQGMIEDAIEIQNLREKISLAVAEELERKKREEEIQSVLSTDPNDYPFAIEARGYKSVTGVTPRNSTHDLTFHEEGIIRTTEKGIEFVNGKISIPANQTGPLIQDINRNRMISAEIAFEPVFDSQGIPGNPVVIMQFGETLESAKLAFTLEGSSAWLYFQTSVPPNDRPNHRYEIGSIRDLQNVHLVMTYRSGELTAYLNGVATLRLRNQISGTIIDWETSRVILGKAADENRNRMIFPFRGTLNHLYLKSGDLSSRQVVSNYNRYLQAIQ